jgi:hypothetical protein
MPFLRQRFGQVAEDRILAAQCLLVACGVGEYLHREGIPVPSDGICPHGVGDIRALDNPLFHALAHARVGVAQPVKSVRGNAGVDVVNEHAVFFCRLTRGVSGL